MFWNWKLLRGHENPVVVDSGTVAVTGNLNSDLIQVRTYIHAAEAKLPIGALPEVHHLVEDEEGHVVRQGGTWFC